MKKALFFYTLLAFLYFDVYGQAPTINNISSFIPAVSQGGRTINDVNNYSANYYTGSINYNASLKNVTIYGINFPILFSYACSGIKVQDVAGVTGLGWTSSLAGSITREVHGIPDDWYYGYCGTTRAGGMTSAPMGKTYMQNVLSNTWDSQPDKFYFNFLGFSGSFVLDPDGKPVMQSNETGIRIDYCPFTRGNSGPSKFILRDQKGNQYFFEQAQTMSCTVHGATKNNLEMYTSAWYITKIITAYSQEIDFTYKTYAPINYTNYLNIRRKDVSQSALSCLGPKHTADTTYNENTDISYYPICLSKISGNGTNINVGYNLARQDMVNSYAMTDISIDYNSDITDTYKLNYSYFISDDGTNAKRLKLDSICKIIPGNTSKTLYAFFYNQSVNLPARTSLKTDYLGFYNNNTQNSDISSFGDKTPYLTNAVANILQKVRNAYGGSINFEYELNDYAQFGNSLITGAGVRIKHIYEKVSDADPGTTNSTIVTYNIFNSTASSGQLYTTYYPYWNTSYDVQCNMDPVGSVRYYSSESLESLFDANGAYIGYSNVTLTRSDGSATRYTFTNYSDYPDQSLVDTYSDYTSGYTFNPSYESNTSVFSNDPRSSYAFARGKVLKEELLDANSQTVKLTTYNYALSSKTGQVIGILPSLNAVYDYVIYNVTGYTYFTQDLQLISKAVQSFRANTGQQSITENYTYTTYAPNLLRNVTISTTGSRTDKYAFRYPFDIIPSIPTSAPATALALTSMTYQNMIASPIETVHSVINGGTENVVSSKVTKFNLFPGNLNSYLPLQECVFQNKNPIPISQYTNYTVSYSNNTEQDNLDTRVKPVLTYIKYDALNNAAQVEAPSLTNHFNSAIYGYNELYRTAEIAGASQADVAYTSFESGDKGNWTYSGAPIFDINSATGNKDYDISKGSVSASGLTSTTTYILTYWTKNTSSFTIAGTVGAPILLASRNGWNAYMHKIAGQTAIIISGTGLLDELRMYPQGTSMITYTYEPFVGVTTKNDENNQITYYTYDEYNRLQFIKDNEQNIVKGLCYNFLGDPGNCFNSFPSNSKSGAFYKNDCGGGYVGSLVTYVVPAGRYTAGTQQAADALAQKDVDLHGQDYANANGTCTPQTIYARIEYSNYSYPSTYTDANNYSNGTNADVYIKLYSDANCQNPYTLTIPMNVIVAEGYSYSTAYSGSGSQSGNYTFTLAAGTSSYYVGNEVLSSYQTYTDPYSGSGSVSDSYNYSYTVTNNGSYYISLPTNN